VFSGEMLAGTEITGGRGRGRLYFSLHSHHPDDSALECEGSEPSERFIH